MTDMIKFEGAAPILRVEDLRASIDYYVNVLGFTVDWEYSNTIASVSRDRCCILLCEREQGPPREDQPLVHGATCTAISGCQRPVVTDGRGSSATQVSLVSVRNPPLRP